MSFGQQITKSIEKQDQNNAFFGLEQLDINNTVTKIKLDHRFSPVNVNSISLAGDTQQCILDDESVGSRDSIDIDNYIDNFRNKLIDEEDIGIKIDK